MKRIGIIGGGQLGLLLAMSIKKLGAEVLIYDPDPQAPACLSFPSINADWQNKEALADFLSKCHIATYEFENISYETLAALNHATQIIPSIDVLRITQNRANEKEFLRSNNLPHVPYIKANNISELKTQITELQFPVILKSTTGGYDGKSQMLFKTKNEFENALVKPNNSQLSIFPLIAEQAIDLYMEVSCITASSLHQEQIVFPVFENVHRQHILETTIVPANISPAVSSAIQKLARTATDKLKVQGLLCTEFFISRQNKDKNIKSASNVDGFNICINEFAPRPHNSGHITMLSCDLSQFDILAHILLDMPIPEPVLPANSYFCMLNLLGDIWLAQGTQDGSKLNLSGLDTNNESFQLCLYSKKEARHGRKMGHIITKAQTAELAKNRALAAREKLIAAACLK